MGIGPLGDVHDFLLRGTRLAISDVFANGAGKEVRLLEDYAHRGSQARGGEIVYSVPQYIQVSGRGMVKA